MTYSPFSLSSRTPYGHARLMVGRCSFGTDRAKKETKGKVKLKKKTGGKGDAAERSGGLKKKKNPATQVT